MSFQCFLLKCHAGDICGYKSRSIMALSGSHLTAMILPRAKLTAENHLPPILYMTLSAPGNSHSITLGKEVIYSLYVIISIE